MSSFTRALTLDAFEPLDQYRNGRRLYRLLEPFTYHIGTYPSPFTITIPAGTITDGASVPRGFHWFLPVTGNMLAPALVHDFLMDQTDVDYWLCHSVLVEAMRVARVPCWKRAIVFTLAYGKYHIR